MLSDFLRIVKGFVLFIGPTQAGKTSILRRLVTGKFEDQQPTLGFREENIAKVHVIEIGGQLEFKKHWEIAFKQNPAHTFYIVDITKKNEIEDYDIFVKELELTNPGICRKITLVLNKIDKIDVIPKYESITSESITCSAKTGESMIDILEAIASNKDTITVETDYFKDKNKPKIPSTIHEDQFTSEALIDEYKDKF